MTKIVNKNTGTFEATYKKLKTKREEKLQLRHVESEDLILDKKRVIAELLVHHPGLDCEYKFIKKRFGKRSKVIRLDPVEAEEFYILLHEYWHQTKDIYRRKKNG